MLAATFSSANFVGYVYETDGEIIGYIGADRVFETADILLVATNASRRREGIATSLMNAVFKALKEEGTERALLEVRRENAAAISLYEKCGFYPIGERKGYYGSGADAIIMEKKL